MVHRRGRSKDGPWELNIPTRVGWRKASTGTRDKSVAKAMELMVAQLGPMGAREWDLLEAVALPPRRLKLAELFDAYRRRDLEGLRTRMDDLDLAPYLDRWQAALAAQVHEATRARYLQQVRTLIPAEQLFPRSRLSPDAIDRWLAELPGKPATKSRHLAALMSFVSYLRGLRILTTDPLDGVARPTVPAPRCEFLELPDVQRLIAAAPADDQVLYALCYGAGAERSAALAVQARHLTRDRREVRLPGTKGRSQGRDHRDRTARIAEWAWPIVEARLATLTPDGYLVEGRDGDLASKRHAALAKALQLSTTRLHDARHHWAVRMARAGMPVEMIARQLGHKDPMMALRIYGRFLPNSDDRDRWEKVATAQDSGAVVPPVVPARKKGLRRHA